MPRNTGLSGEELGDTMEEKELLTIGEFTCRYSISRTSLYREIQAKRLCLIKRGRRSLISRIDAAAWVDALRNKNVGAE